MSEITGAAIAPAAIDLRPLGPLNLNLDQYFGVWAVEERHFLELFAHVGRMDLVAHVQARDGLPAAAAPAETLADQDGKTRIALVQLEGTLTKHGSSLSGSGSMLAARRAVRQAARDDSIAAILLAIDSPGGTVAGTADLAAEVAAAGQKKPVWAFIEDLGASAAYWIASQAEKVFANTGTAVVGSIGTYMALYDMSGAAAREGIKAVVIRAGKFKGAGLPGTEITEEQKAYFQSRIDKMQQQFTAAIAAGRSLAIDKVEALADGRVHLAADAQQLGLIDAIKSFDEVLAELQVRAVTAAGQRKSVVSPPSQTPSRTRKTMSEDSSSDAAAAVAAAAPGPASFAELRAALAGATAEFLCGQLEAKTTVETARAAWMQELSRQLAAARAQIAQLEAAAADKKPAEKPGLKPVGGATAGPPASETLDPVTAWEEAIAAKMAGPPKMDRPKAIKAVVRENPDLQTALLEHAKTARGR